MNVWRTQMSVNKCVITYMELIIVPVTVDTD